MSNCTPLDWENLERELHAAGGLRLPRSRRARAGCWRRPAGGTRRALPALPSAKSCSICCAMPQKEPRRSGRGQ